MHKEFARRFFRTLADERGSQNAKSAVGIFFFFIFIAGGAFLNSSSLPLSYNIAFGNTNGNTSGSGNNSGGGGGGYSYLLKTKARIDYLRLTVTYDNDKTETKNFGSISNDVTIGKTGWIFPENASVEDGNRSIAEMQFGESSYYLYAFNFGFAIPRTASISGITLDIKRSAEGSDAIRDYSVRLFTGGKPSGAEYAKEEPWSAHDEFRIYGGANNVWEMDLTPEDVNKKSFGIVIAARNGGAKLASSAQPVNQAVPAQQISIAIPATILQKTAVPTDIETLVRLAEKEKRGKNVEQLQNILILAIRGPEAEELAAAGSTGNYGPITKRAVAKWRKSNRTQGAVRAEKPAPIPAQQLNIITMADADNTRTIKTPLFRGNKGPDVQALQRLLIKWNAGPEALTLTETGATGVYGWRTERAVAELQDLLINAVKGPEAWKLANALLKYAKGSWGELTKAAVIEYVASLR